MNTATHPFARVLLATCMFLAVSACATRDASNAADDGSAALAAYQWPLKPFHRAHPVRATFGDPRTLFFQARRGDALASSGTFSFHDGVDIDAPNGSGVYPVVSGVVRYITPDTVCVQAADGRAFLYTHIVVHVRPGQAAMAGVTVLGRVKIWNEHLHFSELSSSGHHVNPLLPGHLTPYRDTTRPVVTALDIRGRGERSVTPLEVQGRIALVADAHDLPMPIRGEHFRVTAFARDRFGVTPASVSWSMSPLGGRRIVRATTVFDYRRALPDNSLFWRIYARGTYQNRPPVTPRYHQQMPGRYLFVLTSSFDTTKVRDGVYVVTVTATDARGNTGSLASRIEIRNHDSETPSRR